MSEQNKSDEKSSLATPGIAIVAILLSLFAAQETILKSNRPPTIDSERTVSEDVRSRLWQDPFQAVEEHRKQHRKTQNAPINLTTPEEISFHNPPDKHTKITFKNTRNENALIQFPEISDQFGYEYNHGPTRVCYDPVDMQDRKDKPYKDSKILAHSIEELRCKIKSDKKTFLDFNKKLHVLAVMVPGGPYAEDKERRLRARYAVISALTDLAYTPQDPEHIEFVEFKETCNTVLQELRAAQLTENQDQEEFNKLKEKVHLCHMGAFMPYEWFKKQNNHADKILVLWLDNGGFANSQSPLNTIAFLKKELNIKESFGHLSIIGPHGSDSLNEMYREISKLSFDVGSTNDANDTGNSRVSLYKNLEDSYIYTATATVKEERLYKDFSSHSQKNREWLNTRIIRTISTQDKLANTILCELALRGVIPYHVESSKSIEGNCKGLSGFVLADNHKPHHIALIGERDTFYSQELTESLLDAIRSSSDNNNSQLDWVHSFPYLRGLDGITSEYSPTQKDNKNKESQANNPNSQETKDTIERPVGSSQLDYLRSLAEQIKRLDNQHAGEGGIKAIGITGSDTYDKLLILQALRKKFPKTLFFTTDLDARLFYPTEIKWTRNLLVASPFGLQLNDKVPVGSNIVQKKGAPFRDVYQTSIYLTILLAMQCYGDYGEIGFCGKSAQDKANEWTAEPRMFEIGNYGAIDLSHSHANKIHQELENAKYPLMQTRGIELGSLKSSDLPQYLFLIVGLFSLALFLGLVLPSRYHTSILVITVLSIFLISFYFLILFDMNPGSEPLSFSNGISSWPAAGIRFLTICLVAIFLFKIYLQIKKSNKFIEINYLPSKRNNEAAQERATAPSLPLFNTGHYWNILWIDNWKKTENDKPVEFTKLWREYLTYQKWSYVVLRISILFLIYFLCIAFFGFWKDFFNPSIPFRGEYNFSLSRGVIIVAAFVFFTLIFAIVDISHLTSHFVSLLKEGNINLDKQLVDNYCQKFNLPEAAVKDKILMNIIYKVTKTINGFIYYPFIFLFLFILARNSYFDNWQFTPPLFFIIGFTVFIAWCSTFRLTKAAKIARKEILKRLHSLIQNNNSENSTEIKLLITEIESFNKGPFLPLTQHPMVLSWLIPLGSAGGGYLLNYFAFSTS